MAVVYIIDDDNSILRMLSKVVKTSEHEYKTFSCPEEAVEAIKLDVPNLVFIDLNYKDSAISGYDVLKERMSNEVLMKIPFIVISSSIEMKYTESDGV